MNIPEIKPLRFGGICYVQDIDGMPLVRRDGTVAFSTEKGALESIKARGYDSCKMLDGSVWNKESKQ